MDFLFADDGTNMMITTIKRRYNMSFYTRNVIVILLFSVASVVSSSSSCSSLNYYNDVCQSSLCSRQCNVNSREKTGTSSSTFQHKLAFQTNQQHSLQSRLVTKNSNCRYNTLNFINILLSKQSIIIRMSNDKINDSAATTTGCTSTVNDDNKFGMIQRIDSGKSFILGAIVGSIAIAPFVGIHDILFESIIDKNNGDDSNGIAQFEYDCDTSVIIGGLFSVVYRYCIRTDTTNPQLQQGIVGAFAITRILSRVRIPHYCTSIPLTCGEPFTIIDWNIIQQLLFNSIESFVLFGTIAIAIEIVTNKGYISRFPG